MNQAKINVTIGTAGHIDHGKTALVKLLTGCETDTLRAEKERGMSIDLGFAPCTIGGLGVGIVDVPGHEHFIKTMVAGAAGMDAVMLVVAADDGVMPQTREHLDILTLLGIESGLVALTKTDRVAPERVDERRFEIEDFLRGTFLEGARIVPVSNVTGEGFEDLYNALSQVVDSVVKRSIEGVFRMPVDRAFSVKGVGTVVTGIPVSGRVAVGDEVVLFPAGESGRINAIQVYGDAEQGAVAGQCAALNVRHWDHNAIERGMTVAAPGFFDPRRWFACTLKMLGGSSLTLKNGAKVRFHTGTSETTASLYLMAGDALDPGEEGLVQMRSEPPLVAGPGDRFIVRSLSPVATVGGGMIIEALEGKLRRSREGAVADLARRAAAVRDAKAFTLYCLQTAGAAGATVEAVSYRTKTPVARVRVVLDALVGEGAAANIGGGLYMEAETAERAGRAIERIIAAHHIDAPESPGPTERDLLDATGLEAAVFDGLVVALEGAGRIMRSGGRAALAGHEAKVPEEDRELFERVEAAFRNAVFKPPTVDEVIAATGFEAARVKKAVGSFLERGRLVRVSEGMFFHREVVEEAGQRLEDFIRREGKLESVKFKYLLGTTRKYAIPLLDWFDAAGVTVRVGNTRYLKQG